VQWLTYWTILGGVTMTEGLVTAFVDRSALHAAHVLCCLTRAGLYLPFASTCSQYACARRVPFYYNLKFGLLLWLQHPATQVRA